MMLPAAAAAGRDLRIRLQEGQRERPHQDCEQQTGNRPAHEHEDCTTSQWLVTES